MSFEIRLTLVVYKIMISFLINITKSSCGCLNHAYVGIIYLVCVKSKLGFPSCKTARVITRGPQLFHMSRGKSRQR